MITRERIRFLLINRRMILDNITIAARTMIVKETEQQIIEALTLAAKPYNPDRVQTETAGDAAIDLLARKDAEKRDESYSNVNLHSIVDSARREIGMLDYYVLSLTPVQQSVMLTRYYDGMTRAETADKLHYSKRNVTKITDKAIGDIAERWRD